MTVEVLEGRAGDSYASGMSRLSRTRLNSAIISSSHTMAPDNAQRPRPPPNRRRDKVQLSCDPCKSRKYVLDSHSHHKVVYAELCQAEVRPTASVRSLLKAWPHQLVQLCDNIFFHAQVSATCCSATVHKLP